MKKVFRYNEKDKLKEVIKPLMDKDLVIAGIGTDICIGDSLGPMVAQLVKEHTDLKVYGHFNDLITALNAEGMSGYLEEYDNVLAIDASLANIEMYAIRDIIFRDGSGIRPGKGVGKEISSIGNNAIVGVVGVLDDTPFLEKKIRFGMIYEMAKTIADAIIECYQEVVLDNQEQGYTYIKVEQLALEGV